MRIWRVSIALVMSGALLPAQVQAVEPLPADDARIQALGSEDGDARAEASKELTAAGASAVVPLLAVMDKDERTAGKMAYETLFRIAQQAAGTDRQAEVAGELVRELQAEHSIDTRRKVCRLLSFAGGDESVDALYRAMGSEELAEMARWALVRIPTHRAIQALVGGLQVSSADARVGLLRALGERGNSWAVPALQAYVASIDPAVSAAALAGLALIADKGSLATISEALETDLPGATGAMLALCETMIDGGMTANAVESLAKLADRSSLTDAERCRVLHALGRAGGKQAVVIVLNSLPSANSRVRGAAVQACAALPGKEATAAIAEKMAVASGPMKADLLEALGRRGEWMDEASAGRIVQALGDKHESVQVAAIRAIETAGIASGTPALLKLLEGPAGPAREAAEHAINHMPGEQATAQLIEALGGKSPEMRAMLVLALAHRGGPSVLPVLTEAAKDKNVAVRTAAFKAMGVLGEEAAFDTLLAALKGSPGPDRDAAEQAMARLQGDSVTARILTACENAPESQKPPLLRVIGRRKHPDATRLLAKAATSENGEIRAAAEAGLGRQDDPQFAPILLGLAKDGPANVTQAAVTGYLRAAQQAEGRNRAAAGKMYVEALKLAATDDQKRDALKGITRTVDPGDASLLPVLAPYLSSGNVRQEAAEAVAGFALRLPESRKAEAIGLLKQVVELSPSHNTTSRAVERLHQLGVDVDPARDAGFITTWCLIGPFPNPGNEMFDKSYFPEKQVDLESKQTVGDVAYAWKKYRTADLQGIVDLAKAVANKENIGAYGYAEITVDADQEVILKIGSDDGIVVWVNGEKVHANNASRGLQVDQDQAKARLKSGVNRVLVKCLNGNSDWAYCVRITKPDGQPVSFKQRLE